MQPIESPGREELLESSYIEGGTTISGLKLRPFSLGTLSLARQLKLTLFTGPIDGQAAEELSEQDQQWQIAVFAWMQSAPLKEVMSQVRSGAWRARVEDFQFELEVGALPLLMQEIERISRLAAAAAVEVQAKPSEKSDDSTPGNS